MVGCVPALGARACTPPQRTCFSTPLQQQELEGVKRVVRENMANGVVDDGITEMGACAVVTAATPRPQSPC